MTLRNDFAAIGQLLFRFRSFLPLTMLIGLTCLFWRTVPRDTGYSTYVWRTIACGVTLAGMVVRCATIGHIPRGTSGRNTKRQKASFLNTTGIYSVVRNPLYLGNALVWLGITFLLENLVLTGILGIAIFVYYLFVVFTEEEYLTEQFGERYARYASSTPAFIPRLDGWKPSDRPFSWRMVIRREHDSIFSAVTGLVFVFHCMDYRAHWEHFLLRREWAIPWAAIAGLWIIIKILKKKTNLLHVPREWKTEP
jgi:protein-S-isoprenylcysteine O-methyltransferase Ste14